MRHLTRNYSPLTRTSISHAPQDLSKAFTFGKRFRQKTRTRTAAITTRARVFRIGTPSADRARLPDDLDARLDEAAAAEQRSKNAILISALEEYRQRRELAHVLELADETARDHRNLLDRLGDA
ncbi:ribbon-helix-helix protein, CopG family [Spirillospora sp. NPDC049024]